MALKIVTGGTTGAADGTLVSSGNPLVITALNTAIDAHMRCDDGYWSNDQTFDVPAELQVSFDGGSTWKGNADEPITAPELYAVNVPIKIRQTTVASSTSGSFTTDGTYTAIAALSTPTLTATVVGDTQIDLSWTNVANENASPGYTLERSTAADFSANLVTVTKDANVTTHSATGLTAGTHYYFRVKAEGSGRYSDSGWGSDDDTTTSTTTVEFQASMTASVRAFNGANTWATARNATNGDVAYNGQTDLYAGRSFNGIGDTVVLRTHLHFDTSSLPDGATIVSARLRLYGSPEYPNSGFNSASSAVLVESTSTAGASVATTDYSAFGSTELAARIAHAAWVDGGFNDFTLNTAGKAAISKTGTTRLGVKQASDFDNSNPGSTTHHGNIFRGLAHGTSAARPILEVTYTV